MLPLILCVSQQECYNSNLPHNGHRYRERTKALAAKHVNVGVICDFFLWNISLILGLFSFLVQNKRKSKDNKMWMVDRWMGCSE